MENKIIQFDQHECKKYHTDRMIQIKVGDNWYEIWLKENKKFLAEGDKSATLHVHDRLLEPYEVAQIEGGRA